MKTILIVIFAVLVVAVVAILILASMKPDIFVIQRSQIINASSEKIFPLINDYKNWVTWSPYEKIDPAMVRTYSGTPSGVGSIYEWTGNKNIGHGRMEITDTAPPSGVTIKLDFFTPFEAHNIAEFTLKPEGNATNVTWTMRGPLPYMAKVMHTVFNMDRMVGGQFAEGLSNMKAVAEK